MPPTPVSDFLRNLPSTNRENFTRLSSESPSNQSQSLRRNTVYVPTKDTPSEQIIITEKTNILLRFLHQQWEKKAGQKRRESSSEGHENSDRKKPRMDSPNSQASAGNNSAPSVNHFPEI
uniref:DET1- and DDB1-associated protein 1 n=1 Tax=Caligus clemensi TaxID=344056 RepID=C1C176_CALCM|nr:DET1- and DDB1-associated protein 1 [Caligus clemensi]